MLILLQYGNSHLVPVQPRNKLPLIVQQDETRRDTHPRTHTSTQTRAVGGEKNGNIIQEDVWKVIFGKKKKERDEAKHLYAFTHNASG